VVAAHYKEDDLSNSWTRSSDISGYHADIHEGHDTVGAGQENGMACVNSRHCMAEEQHGRGMLCVNRPLLSLTISLFILSPVYSVPLCSPDIFFMSDCYTWRHFQSHKTCSSAEEYVGIAIV
jgi:hypothetical protein